MSYISYKERNKVKNEHGDVTFCIRRYVRTPDFYGYAQNCSKWYFASRFSVLESFSQFDYEMKWELLHNEKENSWRVNYFN